MDHALRPASEQQCRHLDATKGEPRFVLNWYQVLAIEQGKHWHSRTINASDATACHGARPAMAVATDRHGNSDLSNNLCVGDLPRGGGGAYEDDAAGKSARVGALVRRRTHFAADGRPANVWTLLTGVRRGALGRNERAATTGRGRRRAEGQPRVAEERQHVQKLLAISYQP